MAKKKKMEQEDTEIKSEEIAEVIENIYNEDERLKTANSYDCCVAVDPYPERIRDFTGKIKGVEHSKDKYGFVDWKSMIDKKYFVLNKWNYASKYGVDVMALSQEEKDKMVLEAKDEDLLILLNGFKEVAKLRGYRSINSELVSSDGEKSVVKVTVDWTPNFETNYENLTVSAIKSSSPYNTHKDFVKYSEAIAENRAFVTVVRNTLSIPVIGSDEIKEDEEVEIKVSAPKPNKFLQEFCDKHKISFGKVKSFAEENSYEWKDSWESYSDLSASIAGSLLHDLSSKSK